jgi:hypothetical protein
VLQGIFKLKNGVRVEHHLTGGMLTPKCISIIITVRRSKKSTIYTANLYFLLITLSLLKTRGVTDGGMVH